MSEISHTGAVTVLRRLGAVLAVVAVALLTAATTAASAAAKDPFAALDRSMRDRVKDDDLAGAVLLVVRDDAVIHATEFGALDADSVIPIASASKWLTSATLMTLVDDGKVSLDESIATYLPEFKGSNKKKAITVRQLLAHTHGLPYASCIGDPTTTTANCTAAIANGPDPVTRPGKVFSYGGVGYEVAARIIEVISGQSFEDAFETRIARPLGMTHTSFDEYQGQRFRHPQPSGSAVSSVDEYAKFLAMLTAGGESANGRVLTEDSVAEIERDQVRGIDTHRDAAVQITNIPTYGLGVWRDVASKTDDIEVVSGSGAYGFYPWIDRRNGNYGIVGVADLTNGAEHAVPASQRQARVAWRAAAHWVP
ncbi:MAG TPA: serine hydrolase domain-containing protein [Acidimicrobiia bacterium]|nr:serine hydrolase domain-containing protein [Acidimicrobiia bacterium]